MARCPPRYVCVGLGTMKGAGMSKTNAPGPFRPAGAGSLVTFRCAKCERTMTTGGRKQIKRGGLALGWLCRECV